MRRIFEALSHALCSCAAIFVKGRVQFRNCTLDRVTIRCGLGNEVRAEGALLKRTKLELFGSGNRLTVLGDHLTDCFVTVHGTDNTVYFDASSSMNFGRIIIRGSRCSVSIGRYTTFGGVRIINVGTDCRIEIGQNCLFSDNIEIWATDSHSIFDADGNCINRERSIAIGDNVWIGSRVVILKGSQIHNGAVVGMSSLVNGTIPACTVNVGSPTRVVRKNITWTREYDDGNRTVPKSSSQIGRGAQ